jgi:hypothetical protein
LKGEESWWQVLLLFFTLSKKFPAFGSGGRGFFVSSERKNAHGK